MADARLCSGLSSEENEEYNECISSSNWWNRQYKQAAELGGFILGDKRPLRGWGIGEAGDWVCDKIYKGNVNRCEDEYGPNKSGPDNDSPSDTSD